MRQPLSDAKQTSHGLDRRWYLPGALMLLVLMMLAAPWPLQVKAHAILHGLCAQTPDHTYRFGDMPLPFDARMTGIYGGVLAAGAWLVAKRRHRCAAMPKRSVIALIGLGVTAMAVDGFNSLANDLAIGQLYAPQNWLRTLTGMGAGIAIAAVLCHLCAITLWRRPESRTAVVEGSPEMGVLWLVQIPLSLLLMSGAGVLGPVLTVVLLGAALAVVSTMALLSAVLWKRAEQGFRGFADLQGWSAVALLSGAVIILALAGLRFGLERWLGVAAQG